MGKNKCCFIMKVVLSLAIFLIFNMLLTSRAFSGEGCGVEAEAYLYEGDMRMFDGGLKDAQNIYEFVLKESPNSYEALWRLSRFYIARGMAAKKTKNKKREWKEAAKYAKDAIKVNPDGVEGHVYLAISMGKLALFSPPAEKVKAVWKIKSEAEKAIELDPGEQKAYLTLGAWHRNVATASGLEKQFAKMFFGELPEGSLEESLEHLLKSIDLGGNDVRNYYELALTYEALGNYEAAKKEYENALSRGSIYPEDNGIKESIKETLSKSRYSLRRGHEG